MVNPVGPISKLLAQLNTMRGKASMLNKELVTESMTPRTRKNKEKKLRETIQKAKKIEEQLPPDTPGLGQYFFADGGGVMARRRNTQGLTNLFRKYNTSGPLAGAGMPPNPAPMEMQRGGAVIPGQVYGNISPDEYARLMSGQPTIPTLPIVIPEPAPIPVQPPVYGQPEPVPNDLPILVPEPQPQPQPQPDLSLIHI